MYGIKMQCILYILFFTPLIFHAATASTKLNSTYEDYGLHEELDNRNISKKFNQPVELLRLMTNFTATPAFIDEQNSASNSTTNTISDLAHDQEQGGAQNYSDFSSTTTETFENPAPIKYPEEYFKSFTKFELRVGVLSDNKQQPNASYDLLYIPQDYWGCQPFVRGVREECKYYGDCCQDPMRVWEQLHPQTFTCIHIPNQRKKGKANVFLL